MAGDTSLASGVASLFARPLVRGSLLMCSLAPLAGNLTLLASIHRSESTIFLGHVPLPPVPIGSSPDELSRACPVQLCNGGATNTFIPLEIEAIQGTGRGLPMGGTFMPNAGCFSTRE